MNPRRTLLQSLHGPTIALVFALLASRPSFAQSVDTTLWVTNGTVNAVARSGNTLYIGGNFTRVGPATGGGVPLDAVTGSLVPSFPKVSGRVWAVVPDGAGGWYIGGEFMSVGGVPRSNLAHIRTDNTVSAWNPNANGGVRALALSGSTVYVGGAFGNIGGQDRGAIAALDATTGLATSWNPSANSPVNALFVDGATIYVGGAFTSIGGKPRNYIAALDAATDSATSWNPSANAGVGTLEVAGTTVYTGGSFTNIGGEARNRIAALDVTSGAATAWNPNASDVVFDLAVSGSTVYACGWFLGIGGQSRRYIAALDATTGLATSWDPNSEFIVLRLAIDGTTVYAGGDFFDIGGEARANLAALDASTGLATAWDPSPNAAVGALAVGGGRVYAGGWLTGVGGQTRNRIAALDATTGSVTPWNPNANFIVEALAIRGSTVYVGGQFNNIGGQARNQLAALDVSTGAATSWAADADLTVASLAVDDTAVYAGGYFTTIGGVGRSRVAALDARTGAVLPWNPNADGPVRRVVASGSKIYACGWFNNIGGQARRYLASLDALTGAASPWDPNPDGSEVLALAVGESQVYVGGNFSNIGGQARFRIAALDPSTGAATGWNPGAEHVVSYVHALAEAGPLVYVGGEFTQMSGAARRNLAALDATTASATGWNPDATGPVRFLALSGMTAYAGGDFITVGARPQFGIAAISSAPALTSIVPAAGGTGGLLTAKAFGVGLPGGAAVKLARSGEPNIPGAGVEVASDGQNLTATFNLTGAAVGPWDVVVTNPDLQTATLPNGFSVEAVEAPQLRIDLVGRDSIRANYPTAFDLVINNQGNVDALAVPLWITGIPLGATVELGFPLIYPDQDAGEPDWSQDSLSFTSPTGRYLALVIPRIPPGSISRRINLTVPSSVPSFVLRAALTPPWADGTVFRGCLTGGGVISNGLCMGAQLTAINNSLANAQGTELLSGIAVWSKIAWQCEGATSLTVAQDEARQALGYLKQPVEQGTAAAGCADLLLPRWQDVLGVLVVNSLDPNDKLGARKRLSIGQDVPYTVQFENLSTAIAARNVRVVDNLDLSRLDPGTIGLGAITIGEVTSIPSDPRASSFSPPDIPLGPGMSVRVRVTIDRGFGLMQWDFTSIDPATGQPPADPLAGFLPPNLLPPAGQGSVQFTVKPLATLASGDSIHNVAAITFDGSTIYTAPWSSTVDNTAPQSSVHLLSANQDSARFTVLWEAIGSPPDLKDFNIYVSQDGGTMREWRRMTIATADTFHAAAGSSYRFYSQARDTIGNDEAPHTGPNAETTVTNPALGIGATASLALALEGAQPNPAIGEARVWFTLPSRKSATLEIIDVSGRRLMRREVGQFGPGRHSIVVSASVRAPGLYFLRLVQDGHMVRARMAVIR